MEQTKNNLDFIHQHCMETCCHFAKQKGGFPQFLSLNLLERLGSTSIALKTLLENTTDNDNFALEHSCGILLRSSFLDGLVAFNLYKKILLDNEDSKKSSDEQKKNLSDFCGAILSDGLSHTIKHFKNLKKQKAISEKELINHYKDIVSHKKDFFKPYNDNETEPQLIYNTYYSPNKLFQMLLNDSKMKKFSDIYESYLFYSKYDHYGVFYYEISRHSNSEKINRIKASIEVLLKIQYALYEILLECSKDEFVRNKLIIMDVFIIGSNTKS